VRSKAPAAPGNLHIRYAFFPILSYSHCNKGFSLATHTAKPSIATGSMPASRSVSRTKQAAILRIQNHVGDARMLGIILELHHIIVAVVAAHQMRLRAPAHPAYVF